MEKRENSIDNSLNELVSISIDSEKLYHKAAELATMPSLSEWFEERAAERRIFISELQEAMGLNEAELIETNGSLEGSIHRGWMGLKALLSSDDDQAMLKEAIKGETSAIRAYQSELESSNLPNTISILLTSQKARMEHGLAVLKSLDDIEFERK